jgi:hypothetical protein
MNENAPAPSPPPEIVLPEGYYEKNFALLLETVSEHYGDLLHDHELAFAARWTALSLPARRLYVRLISRKGPCLRRDRIDYPEIPQLDEALAELHANGYVDGASDIDVVELLPLALRSELLEILGELLPEGERPGRTAKKDALLTALATLVAPADKEALRQALERRFAIVRPLHGDNVRTFRLLFFGNLGQDLSEFVLRDLGLVRFESYDLTRELRLFPTREAIDDALALRRHREEVYLLMEAGELAAARDVVHSVALRDDWHPTSRRILDSLLNHLARDLERAGDFAAALAFYEQAQTPPARERRARVLARLDRVDEALVLCGEIEAQPVDETEVVFAPGFAERLRRKRGDDVAKRRRPRRPTLEMKLVREDGVSVERLALGAYAAAGQAGFFSENWLWRSLFGLAFWDVVFAPIPGAFLHSFQYGPLDLARPGFRAARAELFDRRLAKLRKTVAPGPELLAVYDQKLGTANRLVPWGEELREAMVLALSRLRGEHLAVVADRLSRDLKRYRRGFPDLFVVRDEEPGFELVEVKGPGDQLRPEQGAWIDYLNENGLPASILRVSFL